MVALSDRAARREGTGEEGPAGRPLEFVLKYVKISLPTSLNKEFLESLC